LALKKPMTRKHPRREGVRLVAVGRKGAFERQVIADEESDHASPIVSTPRSQEAKSKRPNDTTDRRLGVLALKKPDDTKAPWTRLAICPQALS
jgi:hypothetical protein